MAGRGRRLPRDRRHPRLAPGRQARRRGQGSAQVRRARGGGDRARGIARRPRAHDRQRHRHRRAVRGPARPDHRHRARGAHPRRPGRARGRAALHARRRHRGCQPQEGRCAGREGRGGPRQRQAQPRAPGGALPPEVHRRRPRSTRRRTRWTRWTASSPSTAPPSTRAKVARTYTEIRAPFAGRTGIINVRARQPRAAVQQHQRDLRRAGAGDRDADRSHHRRLHAARARAAGPAGRARRGRRHRGAPPCRSRARSSPAR